MLTPVTLLISFVGLLVLELLYFKIAAAFNIVDRPSQRGSSDRITLRGGGVIFVFGAYIAFALSGFLFPLFFLGLSLVAVISFVDDIHSLSPRLRLVLQTIGVLLMLAQVAMPLVTSGSWNLATFSGQQWVIVSLYGLIGLIVVTGAIDIFNFMDGINGITGGYALTVLIALAVACHQLAATGALPHGEALQQLIVLTGLADIVFCFFNFRRRARCFAGDVGSISIAFILLFVLCSLCVATEDLSWFAFMVVYGVDGCLTILHRVMLHEDITTPHRKHAYQLMANELHIPHVVVSLIYMALQGAVDVVYFCFPGYLTLLLVIVVLSLAYVVFMKKYYHLHRN